MHIYTIAKQMFDQIESHFIFVLLFLLSVYLTHVRKTGDNIVLVHVPEFHGVIQARMLIYQLSSHARVRLVYWYTEVTGTWYKVSHGLSHPNLPVKTCILTQLSATSFLCSHRNLVLRSDSESCSLNTSPTTLRKRIFGEISLCSVSFISGFFKVANIYSMIYM